MPDKRLLYLTDEASKHARRIYYLYIGFLTYCALTVVSTKDRQLVIPGEDVRLPIVDIEVSLEGFFIVAPIICIVVFVYYRLYSHRLRSLISQLTEETPFKAEKLYPWMVNIAHKPDSGFIGTLQSGAVSFTTWFMLPLVLFLFAFWYFKKHDPVMSWVIGVCDTHSRNFHYYLVLEQEREQALFSKLERVKRFYSNLYFNIHRHRRLSAYPHD